MLDYRIVSEEAFLTATFGRHKFAPWGMAGGQDGSRNYIKVIRNDGREEVFGKVARLRLEKDDVVRLVTGNGGGFGDPRNRPRGEVAEDLRNGYITPEQAEDLYSSYEADRTLAS